MHKAMRSTHACPIASLVLLTLLLCLITAGIGTDAAWARPAVTHSASKTHPAAGKQSKPTPKTAPTKPAAPATPVTTGPGSTTVPETTSTTNANDSLVNNDVLNLSDPACGLSGMTVEQASRCLRTGDPAIPYPLGNYQMDIHMSTGVTHPINDFFTVLESVMNVIWMLLLYILKGGLTLVELGVLAFPFH